MVDTVDVATNVETQAESMFAAVVFHNIQDVYIPGKDIRCCYSIKSSVLPTPNDWIGLYKVGWHSHKDYLCYEYSPVIQKEGNLSESLSSQNSVLFRGSKLPPEETEFYQFCYVTSNGKIRGASYPFQIQFSKPGELQCNEEEDENGDALLVVRNKTTMLEDSLAKAYDENAALKVSKENAEEHNRLYQDMILQLESQKNAITTELKEKSKSTDEIKHEKVALEEALNESAEKVANLEKELQEARAETLELEKSVEVEKVRSAQTDEDQKKLEEKRLQLLQDVSDSKREVEMLQDVTEKNNTKIKSLEEKNKKISQENEALVTEHEKLLCEIKSARDALEEIKQGQLAMERSLADQVEHTNLLKKENCKLKQELDGANEQIAQMLASFDEERDQLHKTHMDEIKCFEEEAGKLIKKIQDGEKVLSDAEDSIEKVLGKADEEKARYQAMCEEQDKTIGNIQEQLDQERAFNNSLSSASDRQVAELQQLLNVQLEKVSAGSQELESKNQEIRSLKEEIKAKDKVIATMEESISERKHELELTKTREEEHQLTNARNPSEQSFGLDGPYYALQTAHVQLKKQYLQAKKDLESLWRQKSDLKRQLAALQSELPDSDLRLQMGNLKKQIEDLRIRLNMGAEAYKAKFKECRKYQNQLNKLQKTVSGRSTPQSLSPSSVSEFEMCNLKQSLEDEKTTTAAIKKSLDNYKKEAYEAKEDLVQVKKAKETLQRKCFEFEKELAMSHKEKEQRLIEDKELQSHIECLHQELRSRTDAIKAAEEKFEKTCQEKESAISALAEENKNLQTALDISNTENGWKNLMVENTILQEEVLKQKKIVEDVTTELEFLKVKETEIRGQPSAPPSLLPNVSNVQQSPGLIPSPQNICPVCSIFYPPNSPQENFESHVQSHFSD